MYSSLTRRSSSLFSLLARSNGSFASSRPFSTLPGNDASQESSQGGDGLNSSNNTLRSSLASQVRSVSAGMDNRESVYTPYPLSRGQIGGRVRFVRDALREDGQSTMNNSQSSIERNVDFVHIKVLRNNSFVTVTDSKGNKKLGFSNGSMDKGGAKYNRYNAEAVSEHAGRMCRSFGVQSVVIKVNGFTHFKRKKQAIMSWKEGYTNSRTEQNPVVCIEDTTRKPHNGCRLPRKRRA